MSLGWPIHNVSSKAEFWNHYFWQSEEQPKGEGYFELINHEEPVSEEHARQLRQYNVHKTKWHYCRLDVPLGDYSLRLQFDPLFGEISLVLSHHMGKTFQLGWDDQAHWHPHVLRCEELDLICQCIARQDDSLPHPGIPLILLCRSAPVTDSEDSEQALWTLREAWHSLGLFDAEQINKFLQVVDFRGTGVEWRRDERKRWVLLQEDEDPRVGLYTLRFSENPDFPFLQLSEALDAAQKIVWGEF
jgi:hypothetical protein